MKRVFLSVVLFLLFFGFAFPKQAKAITDTSGDLQVTYDEPLFSSSIIWYPGLSVTKPITVKNIGGSTHTAYINASNTSQTGGIADIYLFKITEGPTERYGGSDDKTMKNFWDAGKITLSDITAGNSTTYNITITMISSAGNEFQSKTAKFDLMIGFVGTTESVTITGGGGAVAGAATTVCNDQKPGSSPTLVSAIPGTNNVTLDWNKATDPVSYYLVAYGISPSNNSYGNPNIGDKNTTGYTVSNLSGGVTYCFIVRAGNGCSPGDFSNQICATPFGGIVNGIANAFTPNVLGVSTPSAQVAAEKPGEIKGAETVEGCQNCFWWPIILAEAIIIFIYRRKFRKKWWPSLLIPITAYLIFRYLNHHCDPPNFFCRYFPIIDTAVFILCWIDKIISLIKKP